MPLQCAPLAIFMLWFGKQAKEHAAGGVRDRIEPATLAVSLDTHLIRARTARVLEAARDHGGVEVLTKALHAKHQLFEAALGPEPLRNLDEPAWGTLLDTVFPARRRVMDALAATGFDRVRSELERLLYGDGALRDRMTGFVDGLCDGETSRRVRGGLWDLAAEVLHFRAPEQYPLMTRWVWDRSTMSGALREFIKGSETLSDIPLDERPETVEGARLQLAEALNEEGFYRDVSYLVDLVLALAYGDYCRSMSMSVGMIEAEFGTKHDPLELPARLLGIDGGRRPKEASETTTN